MIRRLRQAALAVLLALVVVPVAFPRLAVACSCLQPQTLAEANHPLLFVGRIGEAVPGGRMVQVERWFTGGVPQAQLVVAVKEGEPVGDCSYRPDLGVPLLMAPWQDDAGTLRADLCTLQVPIATAEGQALLTEALALHGPGVGLGGGAAPPPDAGTGLPVGLAVGTVVVVGLALFGLVVLARRRGPARS